MSAKIPEESSAAKTSNFSASYQTDHSFRMDRSIPIGSKGEKKINEVYIKVKEKLPLDDKQHPNRIKAKLLSSHGDEVSFSLVFNKGAANERRFIISTNGTNNPLIVETFVEKSSFLKDIKHFWKAALHFFFDWSPKASQGVPAQQAMHADYRAVRKSLEGATHILNDPKDQSTSINGLIENSKAIERALQSPDPEKALHDFANLHNMHFTGSSSPPFLISTGYRAADGTFIPLLVRFYEDRKNQFADNSYPIVCEIYSDAAEGGKVAPLHRWKMKNTDSDRGIKEILEICLMPLVAEKKTSFGKESQTFNAILAALIPSTKNAAQTDSTKSNQSTLHGSFSDLLDKLDKTFAMEEIDWDKLEITDADQTWTKQSTTTDQRTVKWLEHLLEKKLNTSEKLSLLFYLSEKAARSQIKEAEFASRGTQLKAYKQAATQIAYVKEKLAVEVGQTADRVFLPKSLTALEKECAEKIKALEAAVRQEVTEMRGEYLNKKQTVELPKLRLQLTVDRLSTETMPEEVGKAKPAEKIDLKPEVWIKNKNALISLNDPQRLKKMEGLHALENLKEIQNVSDESKATLNKIGESGFGSISPKELNDLIFDLFGEKTKYLAKILDQLRSGLKINSESVWGELVPFLEDLLVSPHLLPIYSYGRQIGFDQFASFLRIIQDENIPWPMEDQPAFDALRNLLKLRFLTTNEQKQKLFKDNWEVQTKKLEDRAPHTTDTFKTALQKIAASVPNVSLESPSGVTDAPILTLGEYHQSLTEIVKTMTTQCLDTMAEADTAENPQIKKALLQKAKLQAMELTQLLPTPGSEVITGQSSQWGKLSSIQRESSLEAISNLEKLVWQVQMRLPENELSGRDKFYLLKLQAIRQAIITSKIIEDGNKLEKFISGLSLAQRQELQQSALAKTGRGKAAIERFDCTAINFIEEPGLFLKLSDFIGKDPHNTELKAALSTMLLNTILLDANEINLLLTQDLTSMLSKDIEIEGQLASLFHFMAHNFNRGRFQGLFIYGETSPSRDETISSRNSRNYFQLYEVLNRAKQLGLDNAAQFTQTAESIAKAIKFYQSATDPDLFLSDSSKKRSLSSTMQPEKLLSATGLDLDMSDPAEITIISAEDNKLGYLHTAPEVEGRRTLLPIFDNSCSGMTSKFEDKRLAWTPDRWEAYLAENATQMPLELSFEHLMRLFSLRPSPFSEEKISTYYHGNMPLSALLYLADPNTIETLKLPYVQKFLDGSLFGPLVMQQFLADNPDGLLPQIPLLQKQLERAIRQKDAEAENYLRRVISTLHQHVQFRQKNLVEQGWFSGYHTGSLPITMGEKSRVIKNSWQELSSFFTEKAKDLYNNSLQEGIFNLEPVLQPLVHHLISLQDCNEELQKLAAFPPDQPDNWPPTPLNSLSKLEQMRHRHPDSFSADEIREGLIAYRTLLKASQEDTEQLTFSYSLYSALFSWVESDLVPKFDSLAIEEKIKILNSIEDNQTNTKITSIELLLPGIYRCTDDSGNVQDISLSDVSSNAEVNIPENILRHQKMPPGLYKNTIKARRTTSRNITSYEWSENEQHFILKVVDGQPSLTRTLNDDIYHYLPQEIPSPKNSAERLIAQHGLWIRNKSLPESTDALIVITSGMKAPNDKQVFHVKIDNDVAIIQDFQGDRISTSSIPLRRALAPFVTVDHCTLVVNEANKIKKLQIDQFDLAFENDGDGWICKRGDVVLGKTSLDFPSDERDRLERTFGADWAEYVVPLKKDDKWIYLLLPYDRVFDSKGVLKIDHGTIPEGAYAETLSFHSSGKLMASPTTTLYLADQALWLAKNDKNSITASQSYLQASEYLESLSNMRPLLNDTQIQSMLHNMKMIEQHHLEAQVATNPQAIALSLRMALAIRTLRTQAGQKGSKALAITQEQTFEENEKIRKLYLAYEKMRSSEQFSAFHSDAYHKNLLLLSAPEKAELLRISQTLHSEFMADVNKITKGELFAISGQRLANLRIAMPTEIKPEFLLALLRMAKPLGMISKNEMDLSKIKPPLHLSDLIENFWGYVSFIRSNHLPPEELQFLFQASQFPVEPDSAKMRQLQSLDLQARQFLLAIAEVEKMLHPGKKSLPEVVSEKVKSVKDELLKLEENPLLKREMQPLIATFDTVPIASPNKPLDPGKLTLSLRSISREIFQLRVKLTEKIDAQNLIYDAAIKKLEVELTQLNSNLELTSERRELRRKMIPAKIAEIKEQKKADEAKLKESIRKCSSLERQVDPLIEKSRHLKELMKLDQLMMSIMEGSEEGDTSIKQITAAPQPDFELPEGEESKKVILDFTLAKKSGKAIDPTFWQVLESIKDMGISGTIRLAQQMESGVEEKLKAYTNFLGLLATIGNTMTSHPIVVETASNLAAFAPLSTAKVLNDKRFQESFTEAEQEVIKKKVLSLPSSEQAPLLQRLSEVLDFKPRTIVTQTQITHKEEEISRLYEQLTGPLSKKEAAESLELHASSTHPIELTTLFELTPQLDKVRAVFESAEDKTAEGLWKIYSKELKKPENRPIKGDLFAIYNESLQAIFPPGKLASLKKFIDTIDVQFSAWASWGGLDTPRTPVEKKGVLSQLYQNALLKDPSLRNHLLTIYQTALKKIADPENVEWKSLDDASSSEVSFTTFLSSKLSGPQNSRSPSNADPALLMSLQENLPATTGSQYIEDLKKGFEAISANNPISSTIYLKESNLEEIKQSLKASTTALKQQITKDEKNILDRIKTVPIKDLPPELRKLRYKKGTTDSQLLQACYREYRRGSFEKDKINRVIASCLINVTKLKALQGSSRSAMLAINALTDLKARKANIPDGQSRTEQDEIEWKRHSNVLYDCMDRCQADINEILPKSLAPYLPKILYLQYRLGIVLRQNQLEALAQIIEAPSLLKQMRMGLGKTSTLLPFMLEILASKGMNPIAMVPKGLFNTNFDEMDETTRIVFELAGSPFLFSRENVKFPLTNETLLDTLTLCEEFMKPLSQGSYILTCIESKASLDNMISEIEESQAALLNTLYREQTPPLTEIQITDLIAQIKLHEHVLEPLYKCKAVFEHQNTRILVDEIDQTVRAGYSVNSELGNKAPPSKLLTETTSQIFSIILRGKGETLKLLRNILLMNQQFAISDKAEVDGYLQDIARAWVDQHGTEIGKIEEENFFAWFSGEPLSEENKKVIKACPKELQNSLMCLHKALDGSLRASMSLHIGVDCDVDYAQHTVGVPASQGNVSPTTKYSDPLMQLCLSSMIAFYKPEGESFLQRTVASVNQNLSLKTDDPLIGKAYRKLTECLKDEAPISELIAGNKDWQIYLRLQFAERIAIERLVYLSEQQITRPVQHALNGCRVIGLTGTASRSTEKLLKQHNAASMSDIETNGRSTTAEVRYRMAKSLSKGLDTEILTYETDATKALEWHRKIAEPKSGYRGIIDQAGNADQFTQLTKVRELHEASGRPVIFLDVRTGEKSALIANNVVLLDTLEKEDKAKAKGLLNEGFFYYSVSTVRGTHFDIPAGAKMALLLSPDATDADLDQASYRARALGEGHVVVPFISEGQHKKLAFENKVTLRALFASIHAHTANTEAASDLAADKLFYQASAVRAGELCKTEFMLGSKGDSTKWMKQKHALYQALPSIPKTGSEEYLSKLDKEIDAGGNQTTQTYLVGVVNREIQKIDSVLTALGKEGEGLYSLIPFTKAKEDLEAVLKATTHDWAAVQNRYPSSVDSSSAPQETAETEAEAEAEEEAEQETAAESAVRASDRERTRNTARLFTTINKEEATGLVNRNPSERIKSTTVSYFFDKKSDPYYFFVSDQLKRSLNYTQTNQQLPPMRLMLSWTGAPDVFAATMDEAKNLTHETWVISDSKGSYLLNGAFIAPYYSEDGMLDFYNEQSAPNMIGLTDEEFHSARARGPLCMAMYFMGAERIRNEDVEKMAEYIKTLPMEKMIKMKAKVLEKMASPLRNRLLRAFDDGLPA